MNLEEYNKGKYQQWLDSVQKGESDIVFPKDLILKCPKCNEKLQDLPGKTGMPPQIRVECPKCKYKGTKLV